MGPRVALTEYERYRARRGLPPDNLWRTRLAEQGLPLPPAPDFEPGDAYEGPP